MINHSWKIHDFLTYMILKKNLELKNYDMGKIIVKGATQVNGHLKIIFLYV
jgi:hypothetical protein